MSSCPKSETRSSENSRLISILDDLLLNGDGFFQGVSVIALLIAFVMLLGKMFVAFAIVRVLFSGVMGRYSWSLILNAFQSVFVKLYGSCVDAVTRGVRVDYCFDRKMVRSMIIVSSYSAFLALCTKNRVDLDLH